MSKTLQALNLSPGKGEKVKELGINLLEPNPWQARIDFSIVEQLAADLKANGQDYPILVREHPDKPGVYQVGDGGTRMKAAKALGWESIKAIVRPMSDREMKKLVIRTAVHRKALEYLEEANACAALKADGLTYKQIAAEVNKTESWVTQRMAALKWPEDIRQSMIDGLLTVGQAEAIQQIKQESIRIAYIDAAKARSGSDDELTIGEIRRTRDTAKKVNDILGGLDGVTTYQIIDDLAQGRITDSRAISKAERRVAELNGEKAPGKAEPVAEGQIEMFPETLSAIEPAPVDSDAEGLFTELMVIWPKLRPNQMRALVDQAKNLAAVKK